MTVSFFLEEAVERIKWSDKPFDWAGRNARTPSMVRGALIFGPSPMWACTISCLVQISFIEQQKQLVPLTFLNLSCNQLSYISFCVSVIYLYLLLFASISHFGYPLFPCISGCLHFYLLIIQLTLCN